VWLLLEKGADINTGAECGRAVLPRAPLAGHVAVVLLLLEKGADVNSKDNC
jgi:ankyrin repeat protein